MTSQLIGTFSETPRRRERPRARSRRKYIHIRAFIEQATGPGDLLGQVNGPRNRGSCLGASHRPWELPRHKSAGPETAGAASPQVSGLGTASAQVTGPGDRGSCLATSLRPGNCLGTSQRPGKCLGIVHRPWELPPHKSPAGNCLGTVHRSWELPRTKSLGPGSPSAEVPGISVASGVFTLDAAKHGPARSAVDPVRVAQGRPFPVRSRCSSWAGQSSQADRRDDYGVRNPSHNIPVVMTMFSGAARILTSNRLVSRCHRLSLVETSKPSRPRG